MEYEQLYFDFYWDTKDKEIANKEYKEKLDVILHNSLGGLWDLTQEDIEKIKGFERNGFGFLSSSRFDVPSLDILNPSQFIVPDRIVFPSMGILDKEESWALIRSAKLKNNPRQQQEALDAAEYWSLVASVAYIEQRRNYPHFLDDKDEKSAKNKYCKS